MTKIKKYGIAALIINLLFTVFGAGIFGVKDAIVNMQFGDKQLEEYGAMSIMVLGLFAAVMGMLLLIFLVHGVFGGINCLMMLLQILTGRSGFSAISVLLDICLMFVDGMFVGFGLSALLEGSGVVSLLFLVPFGMAVASFVLHIKSLSVREK